MSHMRRMATALGAVLMAAALDSSSAWTQFSGRLLSVGRVPGGLRIPPGGLRLTPQTPGVSPAKRHSFPAFSFSFHRACLPIVCSASAADEGKIEGFLLDCDSNLVNSIPSRVSVTLLEARHSEAGAVILQRAFDNEYSWSRPLGMPQAQFSSWMRHMYLPERVAGSPPSLVAVSASDDVVGVCTLEEFNAPDAPNDDAEEQPAGMSAIVAILSECKGIFWRGVEQRALPLSRQQSGVVAYFGFLGVNEDYRRQGVGAALVARSVALLFLHRYSTLVAFCTSAKSRALFEQQGFEHWGGVGYQTFTMPDGSVPFASLPTDECSVMVLRRQ